MLLQWYGSRALRAAIGSVLEPDSALQAFAASQGVEMENVRQAKTITGKMWLLLACRWAPMCLSAPIMPASGAL
jgi:hypothetical protein